MTGSKAWRLVLADDHQLVRAGLRALIEEFDGFEVVAEADDGEAALRLIGQHLPDIAVIDISMPRLSGIEALPRIKALCPQTRLLIVSMHDSEDFVMKALHAGANGYMVKDAAAVELHIALEALIRGQSYVSPAVQGHVICHAVNGKAAQSEAVPDTKRHSDVPLTPRQIEVLKHLASGRSMKEIAYELGLSVKTVETHRAQIMERLGIHDVPRLVLYAARHGLVQLHGT